MSSPQHRCRTPVMANPEHCTEQSESPTCEALIGKGAGVGQNAVRATGDYVTWQIVPCWI
ncbi:hypothetical protein FH972_011292 [Carpinus fangiana]|uniref:Uncharacterized protein n=1 Tax=Carpinus fangiana TaxID=176857 RepID=A0A660KSY0_9ROSI|nr:hypothetical protein FH972_011292 [Carpinus fangiana]